MIVINSIEKKHTFDPCNITIGVFDGIHLGHQLILSKLKEKKGKSIVITFENNPLEFLKPQIKTNSIYSIDKKLSLLKSFQVDIVVLLKFDSSFSNLDYISFLKLLKENFNFNSLVVGDDVKVGKDGLGDMKAIESIKQKLQFDVDFIKKIKHENKIISSTWIKELIQKKDFNLAKKLLTRNI